MPYGEILKFEPEARARGRFGVVCSERELIVAASVNGRQESVMNGMNRTWREVRDVQTSPSGSWSFSEWKKHIRGRE